MITHRPPLEQATEAYKMFNDKAEGCIKARVKGGSEEGAPDAVGGVLCTHVQNQPPHG